MTLRIVSWKSTIIVNYFSKYFFFHSFGQSILLLFASTLHSFYWIFIVNTNLWTSTTIAIMRIHNTCSISRIRAIITITSPNNKTTIILKWVKGTIARSHITIACIKISGTTSTTLINSTTRNTLSTISFARKLLRQVRKSLRISFSRNQSKSLLNIYIQSIIRKGGENLMRRKREIVILIIISIQLAKFRIFTLINSTQQINQIFYFQKSTESRD